MSTRRLAIGFVLVLASLVATLALPVELWRTGRLSVPPLTLSAHDPRPTSPGRLWIDTDAACGYTPRTDVDDCLALWLLAAQPPLPVAGISTVSGNAPLEVSDRVTRELVRLLNWEHDGTPVAVHTGSDAPIVSSNPTAPPAHSALIRALDAGPLVILALGPLTNIANALQARPDLTRNVERLIAVMGRRAGHLFHPSEGSGRGTFLGHGPVFRDFNFTSDPDAVRVLTDLEIPTTLIPYDAATLVEITAADLRALAMLGDAGAWISNRSRAWLEYWRREVGRSGFYPFDLMAAAHLVEPSRFRCAHAHAWVGRDPLLFLPLFRPTALLVAQRSAPAEASPVLYCPAVDSTFDRHLRSWLSPGHRPPARR
jgi:inosine-uridine nucleoside N-ribohydrolase